MRMKNAPNAAAAPMASAIARPSVEIRVIRRIAANRRRPQRRQQDPADDGHETGSDGKGRRLAGGDRIDHGEDDGAGGDRRDEGDGAGGHGLVEEHHAGPTGEPRDQPASDLSRNERRAQCQEQERAPDRAGRLRPEADDERRQAARGDPGDDVGKPDARCRAQAKSDRQHLARRHKAGVAQDSTPTGMVTSECARRPIWARASRICWTVSSYLFSESARISHAMRSM